MKRQILKTDGESDSEYYFSPIKNNQIKLRSKTSKDEKENIYYYRNNCFRHEEKSKKHLLEKETKTFSIFTKVGNMPSKTEELQTYVFKMKCDLLIQTLSKSRRQVGQLYSFQYTVVSKKTIESNLLELRCKKLDEEFQASNKSGKMKR